MEEVGHGVDRRFHHGNQAADDQVTGQQIRHGEGDCEMGQGKGDGFNQRLIASHTVMMDK
jgi:hypothetical protein